ncbi:endoglucanase 9-like [Malania oleifera]|uniref:endoglucanase 9-like n=1 Tax=Malania oleifera TaxID=397392 RepID=UPI0025ADC0B6|nr:endoglucanase 9-like [Malania oleifera]
MTWRFNSGLKDGSMSHLDLSGGYYDAGDNVKFGLPMAFTITMLSWAAIEYERELGSELQHTQDAIKWGTDYLLKCATTTPGKLYVQVGDPNKDHSCWQRPEDMSPDRPVYSVSTANPGSDVAGETAAALAAASIVFRRVNAGYSAKLLRTARDLMSFAMKYRGAYSNSLASVVCPFYCSYSGYMDELLWGNAWLYTATNDPYYLNSIKSLGANDATNIFSWDNKFAGARVLLSKQALLGNASTFQPFIRQAEDFMCQILPQSPYSSTRYTRGGLMYKIDGSNTQYVMAISFLLTTYAKYMTATKHTFKCGSNYLATSTKLETLAKQQVDYILGANPRKMSYMVGHYGFGTRYPQRIHHRAASSPSKKTLPTTIGCQEGFKYFYAQTANPYTLIGAIAGGPDNSDNFADDRPNYGQSEPTTYINAAAVGPLAYISAKYSY